MTCSTPQANRLHIGIFGCRNAGKSSLINAITGQDLAVVSDIRGTTTDPVFKAMELLPLGPVVFIDTPGLDDNGELGALRVRKACQILNKTDIALLVIGENSPSPHDLKILELIKAKQIPYAVVYNKSDRHPNRHLTLQPGIAVSATTGDGIQELKELLPGLLPKSTEKPLISDLVKSGDVVILVTPIDGSAPKGRLILPQQQVLRDALDSKCICVVVQESELPTAIQKFSPDVALVVTDSQIFKSVNAVVPSEIRLTSFSILMARYKGNLKQAIASAKALNQLQPGDSILISEGCTHHRQCADIGTVKLPAWIKNYAGTNDLNFKFTSGGEFPDDLSEFKLIVHCGGCMLNEREMQYRAKCAADQNVPFLNYGMAIAVMHGIFQRACQAIEYNDNADANNPV